MNNITHLNTATGFRYTVNQNSLFRSRDWLSANQGPVFPDSICSYLNTATGFKYTSLLLPSAWPVEEPSKFQMGSWSGSYLLLGRVLVLHLVWISECFYLSCISDHGGDQGVKQGNGLGGISNMS